MEEKNKSAKPKWWEKAALASLVLVSLVIIDLSHATEKLGVLLRPFPWRDERFWWKFWCFVVPLIVLANSVYELFEVSKNPKKCNAKDVNEKKEAEEVVEEANLIPCKVDKGMLSSDPKQRHVSWSKDDIKEIVSEQLLVLTNELAMEREMNKLKSKLEESERKRLKAKEKLTTEREMYEEKMKKLNEELEKKHRQYQDNDDDESRSSSSSDDDVESSSSSSYSDDHDKYYENVIKNMDRKLKEVEERRRIEREEYNDSIMNLNREISELVADLYEEMAETEYYQKNMEEEMARVEKKVKELYEEEMNDLAHKLWVESSNCEYYLSLVRQYKESCDWLAKENWELNSDLDKAYMASTTCQLYENYFHSREFLSLLD